MKSMKDLLLPTMIFMSGAAAGRLLVAFNSIIVSHHVSKMFFQYYCILFNTYSTLLTFAVFGASIAASRYINSTEVDSFTDGEKIIFRHILGLGLLVSCLVMLFSVFISNLIAVRVYSEPSLAYPFKVISASIPFSSITATLTGILLGKRMAGKASIILFVNGLLLVTTTSLLIRLASDARVSAYIIVSTEIATCLFALWWSRHLIRQAFSGPWVAQRPGLLKEIVVFCAKNALSGIVFLPTHWVASALILSRNVGNLREVATYQALFVWFGIGTYFSIMLSRVSLPHFSKLHSEGGNGLNSPLFHTIQINAILGACFVGGMFVLKNFVAGVYKHQLGYRPEATLFLIALSAALSATVSPIGVYFNASHRTGLGAAMNCIWACLFLGLILVTKVSTACGLAMNLMLSYLVYAALMGLLLWRILATSGRGEGPALQRFDPEVSS